MLAVHRFPKFLPPSALTYPLVTSNGEALAGYRLSVAKTLHQAVAYNSMLVLTCS